MEIKAETETSNISIHNLQAEVDNVLKRLKKLYEILIHNLQAEVDDTVEIDGIKAGQFQSTTSRRRLTILSKDTKLMANISIHNLQAEVDR